MVAPPVRQYYLADLPGGDFFIILATTIASALPPEFKPPQEIRAQSPRSEIQIRTKFQNPNKTKIGSSPGDLLVPDPRILHTSLAHIRLMYDWDWAQFQTEFRRALELNPNDANAHYCYSYWYLSLGQFDQGIAEVRRALELEPLSPTINAGLGRHLYFARRYDEALEQCQKTLDLDQDFVPARLQLGLTLEQMKRYPQSIAEFQEVRMLIVHSVLNELSQAGANQSALFKGISGFGIWDPLLGNVFAVSGEKTKAQAELTKLSRLRSTKTYIPAYHLAALCAGLGKKDEAFQWLDRAYEERSELMVNLKVDPYMDSLRSDPRYADLLRRVGFPQ